MQLQCCPQTVNLLKDEYEKYSRYYAGLLVLALIGVVVEFIALARARPCTWMSKPQYGCLHGSYYQRVVRTLTC